MTNYYTSEFSVYNDDEKRFFDQLKKAKVLDAKGIKSNIGHYYNHENVGAYYILTSNITNSDYALLIIAWLINNHMKFYINGISNWINKYNIPQSLIDKLEIVHKYDMEAH